jgi:hypothetical protein
VGVRPYLDFDLTVEARPEGRVAIRVLGSPAGEASAETDWPFLPVEVENLVLTFGRVRTITRRSGEVEVDKARSFGRRLHEAVFAGDVGECFRRSLDEAERSGAGLRIRMRLAGAGDLRDTPWELLYSDHLGRFLAASTATPVVRYLELARTARPLTMSPPLTVLTVVSGPRGQVPLDTDAEWERLSAALRPLGGMVELERLESPTLEALQARLRRRPVNILHFVGHGGWDPASDEGVLVFESAAGDAHPVGIELLGMLVHDHDDLRLVVLNSCEGARSAQDDPFAGMAQGLIRHGVPAVVAMQFEITDAAAIAFSKVFYEALADGYPVDAATGEGRKAILGAGNRLEWCTPALYLRSPDGRLFDVAVPDEPLATRSEPPAPSVEPERPSGGGRTTDRVESAAQPPAPGIVIEPEAMLARAGSIKDVYVHPDIPADKLTNARAGMEVPAGESVKVVIDTTLFGSAKVGVVLTDVALHHRQSGGSPAVHLQYADIRQADVAVAGDTVVSNKVAVGDVVIDCGGTAARPDQIVRIIELARGREVPPTELSAGENAVLAALASIDAGSRYETHPWIPTAKVDAVRTRLGLPTEEAVLCVVDTSVMGWGGKGLAFTGAAVHVPHPDREDAAVAVGWEEIDPDVVEVVKESFFSKVVRIGDHVVDLQGADVSVPGLVRALVAAAHAARSR